MVAVLASLVAGSALLAAAAMKLAEPAASRVALGTYGIGGRLAAPAWAEIYRSGWHEPRGSEWTPPDGMVAAVIDPESGMLATEWCPQRTREWFKPGSAPAEPCDLHTSPAPQIFTDDGAPGDPNRPRGDVIGNVGREIGKALKKIFRF
jgi:hypothetical protein